MLPFSMAPPAGHNKNNNNTPQQNARFWQGTSRSWARMLYNVYRRISQVLVTRYYWHSVTTFGVFIFTILLYLTYLGVAAPASTSHRYSRDTFKTTPFCNATTGYCGEQPDIPSPRTVYSSHSAQQYALWYEFQQVLQNEIRSLATATARKSASPPSQPWKDQHIVMFWGDSITEAFRGTAYGQPCQRCAGLTDVANSVFGDHHHHEPPGTVVTAVTPLFLGISGDQTQHILYRINESADSIASLSSNKLETTASVQSYRYSLSFVLLIGTNNLSVGISPKDTANGILAVAEALSRLANANSRLQTSRILVLHVLPRGDSERLHDICPTSCQSFPSTSNQDNPIDQRRQKPPPPEQQSASSFLPWIAETNAHLVLQHRDNTKLLLAGVELLDCNAPFYADTATNTSSSIQMDLFVDRLHPNVKGQQLLAECVRDRLLRRTVGTP